MRTPYSLTTVALALILGGFSAIAAQVEVPGKVRVDVYSGFGGTTIPDLTNNPAFIDNSPSFTVFAPILEYPFNEDLSPPPNVADNYGVKISGFITAPSEGDWVFWLSSDDQSAFYLSTDENPANAVEVAREPSWARQRYYFFTRDATPVFAEPVGVDHGGDGRGCVLNADGYVKCANNTAPIHLAAGEKRAFYILGKEGGGDDDYSIWATTNKNPYATLVDDFPGYPDDAAARPVPISGEWISTMASDVTLIQPEPADVTALVGRTFVIRAGVEPGIEAGLISLQWYRNGEALPDATNAVYNSATADPNGEIIATPDMNGDKYRLEVTPEVGAALTSREAILTVSADSIPPVVQNVVTYETGTGLRIQFDEAMGETTFQPGSYTISGGVTVTEVQQRNNSTPVLVTSEQAPDTEYTVTMTSGVQDVAGNEIATKTLTFRSWKVQTGKVGYAVYEGTVGIEGAQEAIDAGTLPYYGDGLDQALSPVDRLNDAGADFSYGGRLQTIFIAPQTGDYVFWVATDDTSNLYLSTDSSPANKRLIAQEPVWNGSGEWVAPADGANLQRNRPNCGTTDTGPVPDCDNRSDQFLSTEWETVDDNGKARITLTQGQRYYVEVIWSEGGGGDNGGVTFTMAGSDAPPNGQTALTGNVIEWLAPVDDGPGPTPTLTLSRTGGTVSITYEGELQSTTDLGTAFAPVTGATSPYTVDTSTAAQRYYRAAQ